MCATMSHDGRGSTQYEDLLTNTLGSPEPVFNTPKNNRNEVEELPNVTRTQQEHIFLAVRDLVANQWVFNR